MPMPDSTDTAPEATRAGDQDAERLRRGRVLVVGVGGLGAPAALYLAAAGVGTIGLMDGDAVELSNLQRQVIHSTLALGRPKVESAAAAIRARNPAVAVVDLQRRLTGECLAEVFADFDFVVDATDGAETKFLINDGAVRTGTPYSHAGAIGWVGQTMTVLPGHSACYRCLFPVMPDDADLPSCQTSGIIGAVTGAIGIVQASEAIKTLLGIGGLLTDRLLTYDALALRWRSIPVPRNPACPICGTQHATTARIAAGEAA